MKKLLLISLLTSLNAMALDCRDVPSKVEVTKALKMVQAEKNGGFGLPMWATIVDRSGLVCSVNFSGNHFGDQWIGSRIISAQKAYTANAFSLPGLSLSTANLYSAVQPGGSLFGLQLSNPVDTTVAYKGNSNNWGTTKDDLIGKRMGGINVFGGGLALYNNNGVIVGAIGVSGDSSCADHVIAWKMRNALKMDYVPAGVSPSKDDNIIYLEEKEAVNGFKHPKCGGTEHTIALPKVSVK